MLQAAAFESPMIARASQLSSDRMSEIDEEEKRSVSTIVAQQSAFPFPHPTRETSEVPAVAAGDSVQ